jgi:hypothetical protein
MTQTETIVDTSVLEEVVHWIKTLKEVGVSPDTAAKVATQFFLAGGEESGSEDDDEYYDE